MDETVSIYIIRIKGSSYYTLVQFFPEFHTWVRFSLKNKQYAKRDMRGSKEEVFPYAASFVSSSCVKVDTKMAAQEAAREEEVMSDKRG